MWILGWKKEVPKVDESPADKSRNHSQKYRKNEDCMQLF